MLYACSGHKLKRNQRKGLYQNEMGCAIDSTKLSLGTFQ